MLTIYTDGSCWPNPSADGAWSFVVYEDGTETLAQAGHAEDFTTNNRMELSAMIRALMWAGDRPAVFYSDSRYVVDGSNSWSKKWMRDDWKRLDKKSKAWVPILNADLWQTLHLARMPQHRIEWVRGHAGVPGNERADALAESARMGVDQLGGSRS